ncbi:MAG: lipid-A-disaccharide synthase [Candidatus Margulisbacteria bacterium]|jgi:lipid-A-disaccharide synthase|nr:lipid-A-disaccharide synthase [Candidatus Margulisiibacteriota bacterium]
MKKIFISAIETSGDLHAARLVQALKKQDKNLSFYGLGSEALRAEGVKILLDLTSRSTVGIVEPLRHLTAYLRALARLKKYLRKNKFDLFLCVDGQGFHLPLAGYAKSLGMPVVYYISPQEWLWGSAAGGRKVADVCDLIISIFPEEHRFYQKLGGRSVYNGHPLSEIVKTNVAPAVFRRKHRLSAAKPLVALFPGSRRQELANLLPVLLEMTALARGREQFVIVAANSYCLQKIQGLVRRQTKFVADTQVLYRENYAAMAAADIIVSSTGTITLEAALLGTPLIAVYKFPPLSYWLLKKMLGNKAPRYKALPNMLNGREIMPERIQRGVTAPELYQLLEKTLYDKKKMRKIKREFSVLKSKLSARSVLKKNARAVLSLLGKN